MIEYRKFITRQMLRDEPEKLFVFGDNFARRGFGGQAKEMRGEHNAVGICTKRFPSMVPEAFLNDGDYVIWYTQSIDDFSRLISHQGVVVWPSDGVGTGLARLQENAPRIAAKIDELKQKIEQLWVQS